MTAQCWSPAALPAAAFGMVLQSPSLEPHPEGSPTLRAVMYKLPPATRTLATLSVYVCMECSAARQSGQGLRRKLLASNCPAGQQPHPDALRRQHSTLQLPGCLQAGTWRKQHQQPLSHCNQQQHQQHIPTCSSLLPQPHSPVPRSKLHLLRSSVLPSKSSHLQGTHGREGGRHHAAVQRPADCCCCCCE